MIKNFIGKIVSAAKEYLFPVRCPYCGKVISRDECACKNCKSKFPSSPIIKYAVGGYKCISPFPYEAIFKKAVLNFKFSNCGGYARQLSEVVTKSISEIYGEERFDYITCVPMHRRQLKDRGYNQAELLAKECAAILKVPYADTLVKIKQNRFQHNLKAKERDKNVRGVYRVIDNQLVKGKNLLIIDDIITTGNTLGECSRMLMKSGAEKVSCAVLCSVVFR